MSHTRREQGVIGDSLKNRMSDDAHNNEDIG